MRLRLFRRHKNEEAAAAVAKETERRALFAQLAQRPDNVCPFLALSDDRVGYRPEPDEGHRCYAFGDPAPLSTEQQSRVCLTRGYGNCPRYLRGILVIPTDELEALRRPQPMPTAAVAAVAPQAGERRRRPALLVGVLVLLLLVGGGAAFMLTRPAPVAVVVPSPTPTPSGAPTRTPAPSEGATPTIAPSKSAIPTPTLEPTPGPNDPFDHYEVSVAPGGYTLYRLDGAGNIVETRAASFDGYSRATVKLVESPRRSWLVENGDYTGYSYLADQSGPFRIREVHLSASGGRSVQYLPEDQR